MAQNTDTNGSKVITPPEIESTRNELHQNDNVSDPETATLPQMDEARQHYAYVFGYGSIINTETHAAWLADLKDADASDNDNDGLPGRRARLLPSFGYKRGWNFRSNTGFTALGVTQAAPGQATPINGVVFRIPNVALHGFDRREVGYDRIEIWTKHLELLPASGEESDAAAGGGADASDGPLHLFQKDVLFSMEPSEKLWVYVPRRAHTQEADEDHPILQSYVDTVMQGCIEWGGEAMAREFVDTTGSWSQYFLNDTPSSRRPWLFRRAYDKIDEILRGFAGKTFYAERRHPEEFASAFLIRMMRGTWSVPPRNAVFTGRDVEIGQMHAKLTSQSQSASQGNGSGVKLLEVVGMGGVGKTQICTEYCYRHFPSYYGLIIWLSAQSAESISSGYRQLIADTTGADVKDKDTDEVVAEVKARLFRSKIPFLLVFDNLEDHSLLDKFVPNGGSCGHVLVTTRLVGTDGTDLTTHDHATLTLGCFSPSESVELLRRSAGDRNISNVTHEAAAEELADKLGHLPLALGMAAAYMRRCDVDCSEYLARYLASEETGNVGQSLGGKAVEASLSMSLHAIAIENDVALDALRMLSWLAPDQITKPIVRSLFRTRKLLATEDAEIARKNAEAASRARTREAFLTIYSATGGAIFIATTLGFAKSRRPDTRLVVSLIALVSAAVTTAAVAYSTQPTKPSLSVSHSSSVSASIQPTVLNRDISYSADEYELTDQIWTILKSFSLLIVKDGRGSMHRLLGQALRAAQDEQGQRQNLKICVRVVQQLWRFQPQSVDTWQESAELLEHVKAVVSHASAQSCSLRLETSVLARQAGIFSAMALNRFKEAQFSLEQSLKILECAKCAESEFDQARAASLQELGRVYRYEGDYASSDKALREALQIRNRLLNDDSLARRAVAATLHELGILESKKHNLDAAASFLEKSLEIRRSVDELEAEAECASTLHQLAAVHVARRPPSLDMAEALLLEALGLQMQIGQRAATLKQLARVAIRRGEFDKADKNLARARELYVELYGETLHINVAAVCFQQGALAFQREDLDQAWLHFSECLHARRHVYAYSSGNHLEVAVVLHELGCVAFAQGRTAKAEEMLTNEKDILYQLCETSSQSQRIVQARLTNLTWLRKCAKELGNEEAMKKATVERTAIKRGGRPDVSKVTTSAADFVPRSLESEAICCRSIARKFALRCKNGREANSHDLLIALANLQRVLSMSPPSSLMVAVQSFHELVTESITDPPDSSAILRGCDNLRNVLREHGVVVTDARARKESRN